MNELIVFGVGFLCGAIFGIFIMAICVASGEKREET